LLSVFGFLVRSEIPSSILYCCLQFLFRLRQNCKSWEILHIYEDIIICTHCQELMKLVDSHHFSASLHFVMRVTVWHLVRDSHEHLTACIVVLHSNCLFLFNLIEMASWPSFANGFNNAWIQQTYSISSSAQYVTLQKYFLHSSSVLFFFFIPTHKIKTGTANRWETTNSKPPGPITTIGRSETQGAAVRAYLLHSSLASVRLCCVFC
jgi:hypothetical protein